MKPCLLVTILWLSVFPGCRAQQVVPLYRVVPNSIKTAVITERRDTTATGRILVRSVTAPSITAYFPSKEKATGTAVVICPGGGYSYLVINQEGTDVAKAFAENGVAAFVLKYRLPDDRIMINKTIGPLQDAQQAIRTIRERASEWHINPERIGIIGFSAGGHLASAASTHFNDQVIDNPRHTRLRPDFSILVYPVISFTEPLAHKGSRRALLGKDTAVSAKADQYSSEKQVTAETPPAFLLHSSDDKVVPVANSIAYYQALQAAGVKAEMHIYAAGGHGYGLNNKTSDDHWFERCLNWMRAGGWLK
ncbi:alpha/beta hydrolase [Niabella drilacis]|uniref:Acetyl esterase/lipase n=1 Tax=Niabella drilacis (strain DSM 25811 / CCM 8410 / CCUG 62505 / LMG 26954 / E90) TaxID=1285928 RepID=A0A1G6TWU2_NIADE|nr:alpha/beta hydrolase [Niabella drilacis]SDD33580.1 Acetyl esterase/lipase [Niabella drilacis]